VLFIFPFAGGWEWFMAVSAPQLAASWIVRKQRSQIGDQLFPAGCSYFRGIFSGLGTHHTTSQKGWVLFTTALSRAAF